MSVLLLLRLGKAMFLRERSSRCLLYPFFDRVKSFISADDAEAPRAPPPGPGFLVDTM